MNEAWPSLLPDFLFRIFVSKLFLKTDFEIFDDSGHYWGHIGQKPVPCWTEPLWPVKIKEKF